jgi:Fe-S-cluster containining protein
MIEATADDAPRVNPCATCGACCRSYIVPVCGYDVWLICTRQRLSPAQFLVAAQRDPAGFDGFRLEQGGPHYGLMLDKRGRLHPKQPCVFLVRLADGNDRCGVYAERPVVCQSYPMSLLKGVVTQRGDTLCPPGAWPAPAVQRPAWRHALQRMRMHFDVYYEVVARWNARVAAGPGAGLGLGQYYSYLINVYDRLAALDATVGQEQLVRIRDTWGVVPAPADTSEASGAPQASDAASGESSGDSAAAAEVSVPGDAYPWLAYLSCARQIVDGFFPEVAPLPVAPLPAA